MTPGESAHAAHYCDEAKRGCDCYRDGQCPVRPPSDEDREHWDAVAAAAIRAWLPAWIRWAWR